MNGWNTVAKIPEKHGVYLVETSNMGTMFGIWNDNGWTAVVNYAGSAQGYGDRMALPWVTHWTEIPPLTDSKPKEQP